MTHEMLDPDRIAFLLDRHAGVAVRSGLHCAPWAHRTLGTLESGAVRAGIGHGNTANDVDALLSALQEMLT
jgi:selenocysteine lyase/cysteine desulfurase